MLPALLREYLEALGAIVCDGRAEVGLLIGCALIAAGRRTVLLTTLGFTVALLVCEAFSLTPMLRLLLMLNSMFTALALGLSQPRGVRAYGLAALGALFCSLCTPILSAPLGKLALSPLSLPFNLSFYAVLLVAQKRKRHASTASVPQTHSVIA
jgi:urea transporter